MMKVRHMFFVVLICILFIVTNSHAVDFYGARVIDSDVPSSYLKIGLAGFRPIVADVSYDSPAAKRGFQRGDIIVSINDTDVMKSSELRNFTTGVLSVSLFRDKERMTLTIDRPASAIAKSGQTAAEKQSARQRQIKQTVPAVVSPPPVKPDERATVPVRNDVPKTRSKISRDMTYSDKSVPTKATSPAPEKAVKVQDVPPRRLAPAKEDFFSRSIKPAEDQIIFRNKKGEVIFRHSIHLKSLNREQCMLCHRTDHPTHESIQSRLDNHRAAHGFCRGCHQEIGKGPTTECHVCHNYTKKED